MHVFKMFITAKQLKDLSLKVHTTIQPVFLSRKIERELCEGNKATDFENQQCVVYGGRSIQPKFP